MVENKKLLNQYVLSDELEKELKKIDKAYTYLADIEKRVIKLEEEMKKVTTFITNIKSKISSSKSE